MNLSSAVLDTSHNKTYINSSPGARSTLLKSITQSGQTVMINEHNTVRSGVNPTATNMRKMVGI